MEASFLEMIFSPLTDKKKVTEIGIYMTVHVHVCTNTENSKNPGRGSEE